LQSNALKFTKEDGQITIICNFVKSVPKGAILSLGEVPFDSNSFDNSSECVDSKFEKEHKLETLYIPEVRRDKVVIQVIDTGIGIKKKDQKKLFKLFGCL
jgi:signal transduction histidine kinase